FNSQFHGEHLLADVTSALEATGLPPEGLELEITENTLLNSRVELQQTLRRLQDMGVCMAFDDYGTGYASLSLLKKWPITRLKIDRSFVGTVSENPEYAAVVNAILYLARQFRLEVMAEGVETTEQATY